MAVTVGLEYNRPLSEEWERRLWTIAPPSQFTSWLKLVWEPGDAWEPVERWMIYQMRAPRLIRPSDRASIMAQLRGPSPRAFGHYCAPQWCTCRVKLHAWRCCANRGSAQCRQERHARSIDYMQWKLFQETGHLGKRWWCIQGDQGGHRHALDAVEQRVLRIMTKGRVSDTPAPGDLPYADFDARTFHKVAALDKVRLWKGVTDYVHRNHATMDAAERDEGEQAQQALWSWLESQVGRTVQTIGRAGVTALRDAAPRVLEKPKPLNEEAIHQEFIQGNPII